LPRGYAGAAALHNGFGIHCRLREALVLDDHNWLSKLAESTSSWWLIMLALLGGTASYIDRIREARVKFTVIGLVGDWVISGFAGIITAYVCFEMGWSPYLTAAACGVAGHQGGRTIGLVKNYLSRRAG